MTQALDEEWQGRSTARTFRLFDPGDAAVHYGYNGVGRVMGGHAILTVAVRLPNGLSLQDHVHLRITGTNPTLEQIRAYTESVVGDRDANIRQMIHALIWKEAGGKQFRDSRPGEREPVAQTHSLRTFHRGTPSEHAVRFDYPDDPPDFPLVAFDFGVGILQFTRVAGQVVKPAMVWNWQENLQASFNIFFLKLGEAYTWLRANRPGFTWRDWAYQSWGRYNGSWSSSDPQSDYSAHIRDRWAGYSQISSARVPAAAATHPDTRRLTGSSPLGPPPAWPPQPR
ncbi:MAG: hypothetical protein ICV87_13910 [Gemmatimonadetes bacterium]|nr:hypothetical protein [Gemmatimonadota bacterium]